QLVAVLIVDVDIDEGVELLRSHADAARAQADPRGCVDAHGRTLHPATQVVAGARRLRTSAATAAVKLSVDSEPPRSRVRVPWRKRSSVAFLTAWATLISPIW